MNSAIYKHFLITRFNLRREGWETSKNGSLVLTEKWLQNRFILFENYCLPSAKNQTNQNFTWLVFFDDNTPHDYKQRIIGYGRDFPNFKPVFIDGMPLFLTSIQNEIKKSESEYIITTRTDNDDCISKNFIEEIQQNFDPQNFLALDFPDGYTLQIKPEIKIGFRKQVYNPFISLVEINNNPQSVWSREIHSSWKKEKNVKRITGKRIWMSVIHLENKKNEFAGYGKVDVKKLFDEFPISSEMQSELINTKQGNSLKGFRNRIFSNWRVFYKDAKRKAGLYK